jgi:hypothetical protein
MKYRVAMKEGELIKQLESTKLPDIKLESHQSRLKVALLTHGYSRKEKETTFLEKVTARTTGIMDTMSGVLLARRPVWKVTLATFVAVIILFVALFSIPQTSAILKSTFFPEGSRTIGGPQLTADEQKEARDILMADSRITAILAQGAVIDKILPIEVTAETVNPQTGNSEVIKETWAQAWLVLGSKDWGVQIDLVSGQIVSITP